MNKPSITLAKMRRMRKAIEREGLPFRGFKHNLDGSVEALVGEPAPLTANDGGAQPSNPSDDEFAEWASKHGYG